LSPQVPPWRVAGLPYFVFTYGSWSIKALSKLPSLSTFSPLATDAPLLRGPSARGPQSSPSWLDQLQLISHLGICAHPRLGSAHIDHICSLTCRSSAKCPGRQDRSPGRLPSWSTVCQITPRNKVRLEMLVTRFPVFCRALRFRQESGESCAQIHKIFVQDPF
jgi:hypothetical protein